ncbi:MAG: DUF4097 family beta strand repeat protein [Lachnospiraceae bacterium]|nr:DUF4097 family beta strand repeat protein [Lachnospiraceae bacterium]
MRKVTKVWLGVATSFVIIGLIIFVIVMSVCKWDFDKINTRKYETNIYEIDEEFSSISMDMDIADIKFVLSENEKCKVECYEEEKSKHSVNVEEDKLIIEVNNNRAWYDYIGINIGSPKVTVYLPKSEYMELSIKESTGDVEIQAGFMFENVSISSSTGSICVEEAMVGNLELSTSTGGITASNVSCEGDASFKVSTGKTKLNNFECKNLTSRGNTGNIYLNNVIASETISIKRDTGNVRFDASDANEIFVETDTGDVEGNLLTDKSFITDTDLGKVDVPKTTNGGKCEIITDTGDIRITVEQS